MISIILAITISTIVAVIIGLSVWKLMDIQLQHKQNNVDTYAELITDLISVNRLLRSQIKDFEQLQKAYSQSKDLIKTLNKSNNDLIEQLHAKDKAQYTQN